MVSGLTETVTASASVDVGPTRYYIEIFSEERGTRLAVCGSGTTCSAQFSGNPYPENLVAFISSYSTDLPPYNTQASSNTVAATVIIP